MTPEGHHLRLTRTIPAPRERVFRAWTDAREMRRWFSPVGFTTPFAEAEATTGGRWRVGMKPPEGEVVYASGTFREIRPPERLVFTWAWEAADSPYPGETLVTVEFRARGDETEVTLTHELLPSTDATAHHRSGWEGCLASLGAAMERAGD